MEASTAKELLLYGDTKHRKQEQMNYMLSVDQKGVDMRIGLDIASMAFKGQVDQIILIAGDSDFVPAAKLARREGIDFILDPMWAPVKGNLYEHIDGLKSQWNKKKERNKDGILSN